MLKYLHFFATKEDIVPTLQFVEAKRPLRFTLTCNSVSNQAVESIDSGTEIPDLGNATDDHGHRAYLVHARQTPINIRRFTTSATGEKEERYCIDQLLNPDTVVFSPGGLWGKDFLLRGSVATVSDSDMAQNLMKWFRAAFNKQFVTVQESYRVGPGAMGFLKAGKRLTMAAQCPREYDLRLA